MNPNSPEHVTPDPIFQTVSGFMASKLLMVASDVAIFENLSETPGSLPEIAKRTRLSERALRIVVDAMVALGFLEREGDRYRNGPVAATFLAGRTPADLRPLLRFWNRLSYVRWSSLESAVRTGKPPFGDFRFTEEEQKIFSEGVEAATSGSAQALAASYDFHRHRRILDLGGGTGSFLRAILTRHGGLTATLFELPAAAAVARKRMAGFPHAAHVQIVEGDLLQDPLPEGHDVVLLANVLHVFSAEQNVDLLKRVRARVPEDAHVLLVDFWTDPTHTDPVFAALMAGEFLLNTAHGDVYSEEEARGWLQRTGWAPLERRPLAGPSSVVVARTA